MTEYVRVLNNADEFDNAIRKFGVEAACEYFGYDGDSDFTKSLIKDLDERLREGSK